MIVETDAGRYGFVVDQVIGDYETVIKNLGRVYRRVNVVSGATILGDGTVALILDPHRLVQDAVRSMTVGARAKTRTSRVHPAGTAAAQGSSARTFSKDFAGTADDDGALHQPSEELHLVS